MRPHLALTLLSLLALTLVPTAVIAQQCSVVEPDSLQISWTAPCDDGSWLLDTQAGCRMWDWHADPNDTAIWSGTCRGELKEDAGTLQWFEHGEPIDRFEGSFERNQRRGFGRYSWTPRDMFEGYYDADLPHGQGTVTIDGVSFTGLWRHGCFTHGRKAIAIGVPLATCIGGRSAEDVEQAREYDR